MISVGLADRWTLYSLAKFGKLTKIYPYFGFCECFKALRSSELAKSTSKSQLRKLSLTVQELSRTSDALLELFELILQCLLRLFHLTQAWHRILVL